MQYLQNIFPICNAIWSNEWKNIDSFVIFCALGWFPSNKWFVFALQLNKTRNIGRGMSINVQKFILLLRRSEYSMLSIFTIATDPPRTHAYGEWTNRVKEGSKCENGIKKERERDRKKGSRRVSEWMFDRKNEKNKFGRKCGRFHLAEISLRKVTFNEWK